MNTIIERLERLSYLAELFPPTEDSKELRAIITEMKAEKPVAHIYPSTILKFTFGEHVDSCFSMPVGSPDETSVPVFTHPQPQAKCVPLTEEEITAIYAGETGFILQDEDAAVMDFTRAIEKHHGIGTSE